VKLGDSGAPETYGVGAVGNKVESAGDGAPFARKDGPGGGGTGCDILRVGGGGAGGGFEIRDAVAGEGAD